MRKTKFRFIYTVISLFLALSLAGCTVILQKGRRSDLERIDELSGQLDQLNAAKLLLQQRLKSEIKNKQVTLEMAEKGLVITFIAEVLFDSGKAKIRPKAYSSLDKVSRILVENVSDMEIGVEGHTDNQAIKFSKWKSNWELSSARAMSVLHYLVDNKGISPSRVSAIGYGEYRPRVSNDSKENRQLNRRVAIVILPTITKSRTLSDIDELETDLRYVK